MVSYKNPWFAKFGHDCDIKSNKEDQLPMFKMGGHLLIQIRNKIVRAKMASEVNVRANRFFRSQKALNKEHLEHLKYPYILHPFSNIRKYWELMMIVVLTIIFITVPLDVASYAFPLKDNLNRSIPWKIFRFISDLICFFDVVINFLTGYVDHKNHIVIMDPKKIAVHYMLTYFIIDLVSSVPAHINLFVTLLSKDMVLFEGFFMYCSLLKVFRMFTFRSYCYRFVMEHKIDFIKYQIVFAVFLYTSFFHIVTCINMIFVGLTNSLHKVYYAYDPYAYYIFWPQINGTRVVDFTEGYLILLQQTCYIITFAYLDDIITQFLPYWFIILVWFGSKIVFYYFIGCLMKAITVARSSSRKYQKMVRELEEFMMHNQLPMILQRRLLNYYEFRFQRNYFKETEILRTISGQLKQDLVMHSSRMVVERVAFFKLMPTNLITQIISTLKTEIYMVNDVIIKANTVGTCMYFIASGCVGIYTKRGTELIHLGDGDYFGEHSMIHKCGDRKWNVIATETCELYRFDYNDFVKIIVPHPHFLQKIKDHAQDRYETFAMYESRM